MVVREHSSISKRSHSYNIKRDIEAVFDDLEGVLFAYDLMENTINKHLYFYKGVPIKETLRKLLLKLPAKSLYRNTHLMRLKVYPSNGGCPFKLYVHFEKYDSIFDIVKSWEGFHLRVGFDKEYVYHTLYTEWCMANHVFISFGVPIDNEMHANYMISFIRGKCLLPCSPKGTHDWIESNRSYLNGWTNSLKVISTDQPLSEVSTDFEFHSSIYNAEEIKKLAEAPPLRFEYVQKYDPLDYHEAKELTSYKPFWSPKAHIKCYPELNYYSWVLKSASLNHDIVCIILDLFVKLDILEGIKKCTSPKNIWDLTRYDFI